MSVHVMDRNISRESCSLKTEAEEGSPESTDRSRGPSPLSDSMMSEAGDEVFINDITHDSQEGESAISTEIYGADLQRTLGEILAYCQVTYGAILKLDEKFDMLQAKVANIQTLHQNPALLSQRTCVSSSYTDNFHSRTENLLTPDLSMPHLLHVSSSSPLPCVESRKPPTLSPGPEVNSPPTTTHNSPQDPSLNMNHTTPTKQQQGRVKSPAQPGTESNDPAATVSPANTCCLGNTERKVFLSNCVLQRAGKMAQPSAAARYLLRNIFTSEELSQSSTTGNPTRRLKRLDPNKINAIREWAVKRFPKYDLREKGKDWKVCLSVMNSTARYFRFMDKTRKVKTKANGTMTSEATVPSEHTAEIDVELSDSDTEHKPQEILAGRNSVSDCDMPAESNFNSVYTVEKLQDLPALHRHDNELVRLGITLPRQVYLGPPHREVKVPEFALSAAHLRTRPELIARYLIKFIFPEDVLVRSNVYGARRGIQPLDHNKISALREHLSERFPWMRLEEDGSDWKVCVGAINSTIRKFRYERKMGIKRGMR